MRLYTIGRSAQSQIVLNSEFCSSNHAELLLLDNGDMLLTDKGSSNGTYVNGSKLTPGKEVQVTRQDMVTFANERLNWNLVPVIQQSDVKRIISIGTNAMNTIQLHNDMVSRFHATIKQKNDGKWYICDHSSNGTSVNGVTIPKNQDFPITKRDEIKCAGEAIINPISGSKGGNGGHRKSTGGIIAGLAAVAVVIIGVVVYLIMHWSDARIYRTYSPATAAIITSYYYTIASPDIETLRLIWNDKLQRWEVLEKEQMISAATGFFISEDGVILSNLHVSKPWLFDKKLEVLKAEYRAIAKRLFNIDVADADVKIDGFLSNIIVVPNGQIIDQTNATRCRVIYSSKAKEMDLAIFQTMNNRLPEGASYIPISKIKSEDIAVGSPVYAMGFPLIETLQDTGDFEKMPSKPLQANGVSGDITQNNHKIEYNLSVPIAEGSSGSPVFDRRGRLVGVVNAGILDKQGFNFAVKARYINRLLQEAKEAY